MDLISFREWLKQNFSYKDKVVSDIACRLKRANSILPIGEQLDLYLFNLQNCQEFRQMSKFVKSQLKQAVKLYYIHKNNI